MKRNTFTKLVIPAIVCLLSVVVTAKDEVPNQPEKMQSHENPAPSAKKEFLPWLLKDFKITKEGATLSVTKEKADYFNLYHRGNGIVLGNTIIFLGSDKKNSLGFGRGVYESKTTPAYSSFFDIYYGKSAYEEDDGDEILRGVMEKFPNPLKVLENYSQFHWEEYVKKLKLKNSLDWRIYEKQYIFPVLSEERDDFLKLVPTDKFRAEIYDGFVVLHRIHSKEEAEKRKDFLLITNGTSKGMWDIVEEYKGERKRPKPIFIL